MSLKQPDSPTAQISHKQCSCQANKWAIVRPWLAVVEETISRPRTAAEHNAYGPQTAPDEQSFFVGWTAGAYTRPFFGST